ncbi:hypothetical protein BDQ17DRAFT_1425642 [Cyathus striatus]|nr:hypothetical protein BDQ17DRAFT_1425642 [Cyathus striatus]
MRNHQQFFKNPYLKITYMCLSSFYPQPSLFAIATQISIPAHFSASQSSGSGANDHTEAMNIDDNGSNATAIPTFSNPSDIMHPSRMITQYLLKKDPTAIVAIVHHDDWMPLMEKGEEIVPELEELTRRLELFYSITAVFLTNKNSVAEGDQMDSKVKQKIKEEYSETDIYKEYDQLYNTSWFTRLPLIKSESPLTDLKYPTVNSHHHHLSSLKPSLIDLKYSPVISAHHHLGSSPPSTSPQAISNAQLATILADAYKENERLRYEAQTLYHRTEKAERIVQKLTEAISSQSWKSTSSEQDDSPRGHLSHTLQDLPENVVRIVLELEERTQCAEMAQQEADAWLKMMAEHWHHLDKYLFVRDLKHSEARAEFDRAVREDRSESLHSGQFPVSPVVMGFPSTSRPRGAHFESYARTIHLAETSSSDSATRGEYPNRSRSRSTSQSSLDEMIIQAPTPFDANDMMRDQPTVD